MEIDFFTVLFVVSMLSLLIERIIYYSNKYKKKTSIPKNTGNPLSHEGRIKKLESSMTNPSYGERLARLETKTENIEDDIKGINKKLDKINSYRK